MRQAERSFVIIQVIVLLSFSLEFIVYMIVVAVGIIIPRTLSYSELGENPKQEKMDKQGVALHQDTLAFFTGSTITASTAPGIARNTGRSADRQVITL